MKSESCVENNRVDKMVDDIKEGQWFPHEFGNVLPALARCAIAQSLGVGADLEEKTGRWERLYSQFQDPMGVFVTLQYRGELRGCIGSLEASRPLVQAVIENARHAAFHDNRFLPVDVDILPEIFIEVSVLTTPVPLIYENSRDLKEKIKPGVHGVIIEKAGKKATFLPQVWEQLCDLESFMEGLCRKADLPPDAWTRGEQLSMHIYTVLSFKEKGFQ